MPRLFEFCNIVEYGGQGKTYSKWETIQFESDEKIRSAEGLLLYVDDLEKRKQYVESEQSNLSFVINWVLSKVDKRDLKNAIIKFEDDSLNFVLE